MIRITAVLLSTLFLAIAAKASDRETVDRLNSIAVRFYQLYNKEDYAGLSSLFDVAGSQQEASSELRKTELEKQLRFIRQRFGALLGLKSLPVERQSASVWILSAEDLAGSVNLGDCALFQSNFADGPDPNLLIAKSGSSATVRIRCIIFGFESEEERDSILVGMPHRGSKR